MDPLSGLGLRGCKALPLLELELQTDILPIILQSSKLMDVK